MLDVVEVTTPDQLRRWVQLNNLLDVEGAMPLGFVEEQDTHRREPQVRLLGTDAGGADVLCARAGCSPSGARSNMRIDRDPERAALADMARVADRLEAWSVEQGATSLRAWEYDYDRAEREFWLARGFHEASHKPAVGLRVDAMPPMDVPVVEGIEFTTLAARMDLVQDVYDAYVESWSTTPWASPGSIPTFERWWGNITRWPGSGPEQFLVALDGDRVAGYAELDFGALGRREVVWNGFTGVRPEYRRRGVATALKLRCIEWARARGVAHILTSNDADNAAMRGINARLGYEPAFEYVAFERSID